MTIWLLFLLLPLAVASWIVHPLLRRPKTVEAAPDADAERRAVLADQLAEIARDRDAGTIDADTAAALATEVKRRLLAGIDAPTAPAASATTTQSAGLVLAGTVAFLLIAGSLALYNSLGLPGAPDVPLSARAPVETSPANAIAALPEAERQAAIRSMVEGLEARLTEEPDDIAGWVRLGRAWRVLGEEARSDHAYDQAVAHLPDEAQVPDLIRLAHAMHSNEAVGQGLTPPAAHEAVMRRILTLDPKQPEALWFVAQAEDRAGNRQSAAEHLKLLLAEMPADAPARTVIEREIARLAAGG